MEYTPDLVYDVDTKQWLRGFEAIIHLKAEAQELKEEIRELRDDNIKLMDQYIEGLTGVKHKPRPSHLRVV